MFHLYQYVPVVSWIFFCRGQIFIWRNLFGTPLSRQGSLQPASALWLLSGGPLPGGGRRIWLWRRKNEVWGQTLPLSASEFRLIPKKPWRWEALVEGLKKGWQLRARKKRNFIYPNMGKDRLWKRMSSIQGSLNPEQNFITYLSEVFAHVVHSDFSAISDHCFPWCSPQSLSCLGPC